MNPPRQGVQQDPVQVAGKALLLYTYSLFKTGEIHDLNNDAWQRPISKLQEALELLIKRERQGITIVVYEGVVMINSNALWLDHGSTEQAEELEKWLAQKEAGGIAFAELPSEDQLRRFFFTCSRHRLPAGCKDPMAHVGEAVAAAGVEKIRMVQRPIRLEGVGRGVRGVATLWHYAKCMAALEDLVTRAPVDPKPFRRIAQELMDACAVEQDLLCGIILQGGARSPGREAIDVGILCGSVARGLGLSAIECVELTEAGLAHGAGRAYPNPAPRVFTEAEAMGVLALRQLQDCYRVTAPLAHRVAVSLEHAIGPQGVGPPYLAGPPDPSLSTQLVALARAWLALVRGADDTPAISPLAAAVALLKRPPPQVDAGLARLFVATVGLLPCGTLVELSNGDVGVVADIDHLRGRTVYRQRPPPVCGPRTIWVERMRTAEGRVVPERRARIALGADNGEGGTWMVLRTLDPAPHRDLIMRALVRRPATVVAQMGLR
ncbi:MAG: hypothetical protein R3F60_25305 [bacterium]